MVHLTHMNSLVSPTVYKNSMEYSVDTGEVDGPTNLVRSPDLLLWRTCSFGGHCSSLSFDPLPMHLILF